MNPYDALGVPPHASDVEVQNAYYKIVGDYKNDSESDNPLAHLAREKIDAATDAYNEIKRQCLQVHEPSQFMDIRRMVNNGRITEAGELLDGTPSGRRDAEWYFLKGTVLYKRGWLEDAYENFRRAVDLNPQNTEYRAALNQMEWQRRTGQSYSSRTSNTIPNNPIKCDACDVCTATCCASMCCNSLRCF